MKFDKKYEFDNFKAEQSSRGASGDPLLWLGLKLEIFNFEVEEQLDPDQYFDVKFDEESEFNGLAKVTPYKTQK